MLETRREIITEDPGVLAYVAYWLVLAPLALPWERLSDTEQRAWRAVAAACRREKLRVVRPRERR